MKDKERMKKLLEIILLEEIKIIVENEDRITPKFVADDYYIINRIIDRVMINYNHPLNSL